MGEDRKGIIGVTGMAVEAVTSPLGLLSGRAAAAGEKSVKTTPFMAQALDQLEEKVAEDQTPFAGSLKDVFSGVAKGAAGEALSLQTLGAAKLVTGFGSARADRLEHCKEAIALCAGKVPGIVTGSVMVGGEACNIYIDATNEHEDQILVYTDLDGKMERSSGGPHSRMRSKPLPDEVRAEINSLKAEAIGQVHDYIATGDQPYEVLLAGVIENNQIGAWYDGDEGLTDPVESVNVAVAVEAAAEDVTVAAGSPSSTFMPKS